MNTKDFVYSWHLSLRVDRPVEGCTIRPHAYMYGKKLDDRDIDKPLPPHSKIMREPPPNNHEFSYRWFRGPPVEPCAFEQCPRRTSFSPHDWSMHALGGSGTCSLQCVSTQSSLYKCTFCNANCFVQAWKTQYTVPKDVRGMSNLQTNFNSNNYNANNSGTNTPVHQRSRSFGSTGLDDDAQSVGSTGSFGPINGSKSPNIYPDNNNNFAYYSTSSNPGTPRGFVTGYNNMINTYNTAITTTAPCNNPNNATTATGTTTTTLQYHGGGGAGGSGNSSNGLLLGDPVHEFAPGDEWVEISRDQVYVPGPDDVGRRLQVEAAAYSAETGELLMYRVVKTDLVLSRPPVPLKRSLVTAKNSNNSNNNNNNNPNNSNPNNNSNNNGGGGGGPRFRIVSYNVLAEIYATQQQYPYCDFWALSWDYRFQNILREIIDATPDVVCLQEVQADHYENHLYAALSEAGFEGVYKQKTRQSMGLAGKVDGCALFWRRSKFHMVESYSIEFNDLAQRQATQVLGLNLRSEEGVAFLNRLSKDNVAQLVVLELAQPHNMLSAAAAAASRTSRGGMMDPMGVHHHHPHHHLPQQQQQHLHHHHQVCIANTHLYSNKDFPDVKLWQCWQLLQELETFVLSRGTNLPLMICGDFNSTPDTAVYDLLSRQAVHPGHPDVNVHLLLNNNNNNGDNNSNNNNADIPNILPDPMTITHSFQLGSAYQTILGDEPRQTNFTSNFKGVLDYIWFSIPNLRPLSAAPIPEEAILTRHGEALPSTEYSSDHIMLIADMQLVVVGGVNNSNNNANNNNNNNNNNNGNPRPP